MDKPTGWNGPPRELVSGKDHPEESVYCVTCGTIFVPNSGRRDCPSCVNQREIRALRDRVDELEKALDERLDSIGEQLDEIKLTTGTLAEVESEDRKDNLRERIDRLESDFSAEQGGDDVE